MATIKRQNSRLPQPKSAHVEDAFLKDFLSASFDPVDYLNSTLPPLSSSTTPTASSALPLADLSNHAQTVVSQLNAHTTRLTNTLTQLTDEILRSSSRLAYQVEFLRGETLSTSEALKDRLSADVAVFLPADHPSWPEGEGQLPASESNAASLNEPQCMTQLRTLTVVRSRLDSVIKTFGDAMEFGFPPSELSTSASFLSVAAPEPGSDKQTTEEKGQQVLQKLRDEISMLLADPKDPILAIEKAALRIEELKDLAVVWKGTAEEKGRTKFIESLAKMVEDRHRELLKQVEKEAKRGLVKSEVESKAKKYTEGDEKSYNPGLGLLSQLQKMRAGI